MESNNRIIHTKDLTVFKNIPPIPTKINHNISSNFQLNNNISPSNKTDPDQMKNLYNLNQNINTRSLSPALKNIVNMHPLQGPAVYPYIPTSTNSNDNILAKQSPVSQSSILSKLPITTQSQPYGTLKIETNQNKLSTQNLSHNNTVDIASNVSKVVPNTRINNMTLPHIVTTQLPAISTEYAEVCQQCFPAGMVKLPHASQLPLQHPSMLSTPSTIQQHSPMYISQPAITFTQGLPQSQYLTSMSLPIQSTISQPLQKRNGLTTSWQSQNLHTSLASNSNEAVGLNIPPLSKMSTTKEDLPNTKISGNLTKGDSKQRAGRRSSTRLQEKSVFGVSPDFLQAGTTITINASTCDVTTEESSNFIQKEKENCPSVNDTTPTTLENTNFTTKDGNEKEEEITNKGSKSVDDNSKLEENGVVGINKKGSKRLRDSKRAIQNRNAQKAFRQRKEKYVKLLESKARRYDEIMQENIILRKEIFNLKNIVFQMEQQIHMYNKSYANDLQHGPQLQHIDPQQLLHIPQFPLQFQPQPPPPPPPP